MLTVNTLLQDRYRIVRQLGQGGMGAVYEAVDERIDKTVAIKEILFELEHSTDKKQKNLIKQAFRREASSLVKARHQAVPDVTDYFSEFDREFLVMEFIEGDDLMKMLRKREKPFLIEEVVPWIDQLLVALNYLHNLKPPIIHRDIKPQNLKINEWQKIKLLDFGVAKSSDKTATITQLTFIGATLSYSPIEQILRVIDPMFRELILLQHREKAEKILAQTTDARCDIFAIGATFYHLLTNYPPVDVTKRTLESWEGKGDPLPNPSKLNPDVSDSISSWLLKSMAIERNDRFSSAVEMRKALHEAVAQKDLLHQEKELSQSKQTPGKTKNENVSQEQILMQAETVRLIEPPPKKEPEKEVSQNTLPSPVTLSNDETFDTFSLSEAESTDYRANDTDISGFETSDKLTEQLSYIDNKYINDSENKNITFLPPVKGISNASAAKHFNYLLLLPIGGLLVFIILGGGFFGVMIMTDNFGTSIENNSTIENNSINTIRTPEAAPSAEIHLQSEPETIPKTTNSPELPVTETPAADKTPGAAKPTVQPVRTPVIIKDPPKPAATPNVKKPTPAPTKKRLSDDCLYNGNC